MCLKCKLSLVVPGRFRERISYLDASVRDGTKVEGDYPRLFDIIPLSYIEVFFTKTNRARCGTDMLYHLSRNLIDVTIHHEKILKNIHT